MTRQDDDLVRRYHEASEQEDARPGAHVREAVRAHAQMIAKAAASASAGPVTAPCRHPGPLEDFGPGHPGRGGTDGLADAAV